MSNAAMILAMIQSYKRIGYEQGMFLWKNPAHSWPGESWPAICLTKNFEPRDHPS